MKKPFIVKYRNETYDISKFVDKHPGGINTLKGLENADMTSRFLKGPPHSDAAMYLMKEYRLENVNNNNIGETKLDESMEVSMSSHLWFLKISLSIDYDYDCVIGYL